MSTDALAGPIVGRDAELAELDAILGALMSGQSACVAVEGEPGIGKTSLLAELRRRAEERGCLVLDGVAAEFERDLPFSVWTDALDAYVASQALDLEALGPLDVVLELGEVLPSLRPSGAGRGESVAQERYRSHRAIRTLLALLAAERPLVLVLDDLHWSDAASIELIGALLRRGPRAPVLFALAFRPSQASGRLSTALAVPSVRRIALGELSEAQAEELLGDLQPGAVAAIYRHGGGNPFYLEQLARAGGEAWRHRGAGRQRRGQRGPCRRRGVARRGARIPVGGAARAAGCRRRRRRAVRGRPRGGDRGAVPGRGARGARRAPGARSRAPDRGAAALHLPPPARAPRGPRVGAGRLEARGARPGRGRAGRRRRRGGRVRAPRRALREPGRRAGRRAAARRQGAATAPRAPAVAAHWFEAALRLLPAEDRERQVDVRVDLARTLRSLGELERCRETLLEALALLPAGAVARRVDLTARCAAIEHWLGRHEEAHGRLARAWDELADRSTPAAAALQVELTVDGLYELDFEQTISMGRGALAASRATGDRALIATAASALALGEAAAGRIDAAREHREEATALVDRMSDAELAPRLETLYYLGWAENYLEHYDDAAAHADRGVAIARSTGEGRLLVPIGLVKGYTYEMQGRVAEAIELCETAVEATRLSASTHELSWALCELAFARYHAGHLESAIAAAEESARVGGRLAGDTMPAGGGGPGWVLAMSLFEAGEVERAREIMHALGSDDLPHKIPVEKCFDWEVLALVELARDRIEAAEGYVRRAEEHAAQLGLRLPAALALRARAAVLLAAGEPLAAAQLAKRAAEIAAAAGARLPAAFSLALAGRALDAGGEREEAIAVLGQAERELDAVRRARRTRRDAPRAAPAGCGDGAPTAVAAAPPGPRRAAPRAARQAGRRAAGGAGQGARGP